MSKQAEAASLPRLSAGILNPESGLHCPGQCRTAGIVLRHASRTAFVLGFGEEGFVVGRYFGDPQEKTNEAVSTDSRDQE